MINTIILLFDAQMITNQIILFCSIILSYGVVTIWKQERSPTSKTFWNV